MGPGEFHFLVKSDKLLPFAPTKVSPWEARGLERAELRVVRSVPDWSFLWVSTAHPEAPSWGHVKMRRAGGAAGAGGRWAAAAGGAVLCGGGGF